MAKVKIKRKPKVKTTSLTRQLLKTIQQQVEETLKELAELNGVSIRVDGGRFDHQNATLNIKIAVVNDEGEAYDPMVEQFKLFAWSYQLSPDDLGKVFTFRGREYKITGLTTRRRKFPITADRVPDGRRFKFPANSVVQGLKK